MRNNLFFIFFLSLYPFLWTYSQNNLSSDDLGLTEGKIIKMEEEKKDLLWKPTPLKAALYSTAIPGLGQLYNKSYWKVPLVIGGLVGGIYLSLHQKNIYKEYHNKYINAVNGISNGHENNPLDANQYYEIKRGAQRYYNYVVLFTIVGYLLNVMDAFIDAHLYEIKKEKLLTLRPQPIHLKGNYFPFGLSLNLKL